MKKILLTLVVLCCSIASFATHVVGGNIEVKQINSNQFVITVSVFRDCNGSSNPGGGIKIYDQSNNQVIVNATLPQIHTPYEVQLGDDCYTPNGLCVEQWTFQDTLSLNDNANGYYVVWGDCCRNNGITNLTNPSSEGSLFYTNIPDPALAGGNSTPVFGPYPTDGYFCVNNTLEIPSPVVDPDGDSLVFSLITPYNDNSPIVPFQNVAWGSGYSLANIVGNNTQPPMSIDSITGTITVHPEAMGVYVFSILVEEYRNGIKIGETIRDVQYEALNCVFDQPPLFTNLNDTISVIVDDQICFDIMSFDADGTDTIFLTPTSSEFDLIGNFNPPVPSPGNSNGNFYYLDYMNNDTLWIDHFEQDSLGTYEGVGTIPLRYCWVPPCSTVDSTFGLSLLTYSLGCAGSDTAQKDVEIAVINVVPPINLDIPDTMGVVYGEEICFDVFARDSINVNDTLYIHPLTASFDFVSTFVYPTSNPSAGNHYYLDFLGQDTVFIEDFHTSNGIVGGVIDVPLRYCWTVGCNEVFLSNFDLSFMAYSTKCNSDTTYKSVNVDITPVNGTFGETPNVFTPNGDGVNDVFTLPGIGDPCYDSLTIEIYNRWGIKVYTSDDPNFTWDGTDQSGSECEPGVYYVLLTGTHGSFLQGNTWVGHDVTNQFFVTLFRD